MKTKIISVIVALSSLTAWAQTDVTSSYVQNADFTNGTTGWTFNATGGSWSSPEQSPRVVEAYAGWSSLALTAYSATQTVTLPIGHYQLRGYAFYRYSNSYNADPSISNAYLVAGDSKNAVATLGSLSLSSYADNVSQASAAFAAGNYLNTVDFYVYEDNSEVKIGFEGTHTVQRSWFIMGPVTLYSYGIDDASILVPLKEKAEALVGTTPMSPEVLVQLKEAIASAEDLSEKSADELEEICNTLQSAITAVADWRSAYEEAKAPLVAALERFQSDYNDNENGPKSPMSDKTWADLLAVVAEVSEVKDNTESYEQFAAATEKLNEALATADKSISLYAGYNSLIDSFRLFESKLLSDAADAAVAIENVAATDESLESAIADLDKAFTTYQSNMTEDFSVGLFLGDNLDFETLGEQYGTYPYVFDVTGWNNVLVSKPNENEKQYFFRTQESPADGATTEHSLRLRSKWDTINTKMQISKDTYLPSGEYTLEVYTKATDVSAMQENLNYYEVDGNRTLIEFPTDWQKQSFTLNLEQPKSLSLSFGYLRDTSTNDVNLYIDDITLTYKHKVVDQGVDTGLSEIGQVADLRIFGAKGSIRLEAGSQDATYRICNLQGITVARGTLSADENKSVALPTGLYIVNNKKIQVR